MRKKIIALFALLACFTMGASAQVYVGGSLGFTSSKQSHGGIDQDGTSFKILPEIGYQLDDDISIGLSIGYSHGYAAFGSITVTDFKALMNTAISTSVDINEDNYKLNSFTFAPYVRYNFAHLGKANLFFEGSVGYTNVKADDTPRINGAGGGEQKIDVIEIALRPGVSFQLSDNISLIAKLGSVGFMQAKEKETDMKLTRFGLDLDSYNLLFGMNFHF